MAEALGLQAWTRGIHGRDQTLGCQAGPGVRWLQGDAGRWGPGDRKWSCCTVLRDIPLTTGSGNSCAKSAVGFGGLPSSVSLSLLHHLVGLVEVNVEGLYKQGLDGTSYLLPWTVGTSPGGHSESCWPQSRRGTWWSGLGVTKCILSRTQQ